MAVAYASHTTATGGSTTATFTKPSGLAVGDLLVAIIMIAQNPGAISSEPTGFDGTNVDTQQLFGRLKVRFKVADSGDVSAGSFAWTSTGGNVIGVLYRFTGAVGNAPQLALGGTIIANTTHVIVIGASSDNDGTTTNFSGYSITGGMTPTFTERFDGSDTAGLDISLGVADGSYTSFSNITAFSATMGGGLDDSGSYLVTIPSVENVTVTPDPVTLTGAGQTPVGTGTANISPATVTLSKTVEASTASASAPKWVNKDKTAPGAITNLNKS